MSATAELLVLDVYARCPSRMTMVSFIQTIIFEFASTKMEENAGMVSGGEPIVESEIRC